MDIFVTEILMEALLLTL